MGISHVLSHGTFLEMIVGHRRAAHRQRAQLRGAPTRSTTFVPPGDPAPVAILQGTAGSTGVPRTVQLSPDAVLANLSGPQRPHRCDAGRRRLLVATAVSRHGVELPAGGCAGWHRRVAGADDGVSGIAVPVVELAHRSRATITAAPNMAYGLIGKYSRRVTDVDLSSMRFALNGGEPIDCGLTTRFVTEMARFGSLRGCAGAVLRVGRIHLCGNSSRTGPRSRCRRGRACRARRGDTRHVGAHRTA